MDRTLACDFDEFGALFVGQRSAQLNVQLDPIDFPFLRLALLAVGRMDLGVSERNDDIFERPASFSRIKADCHRCA